MMYSVTLQHQVIRLTRFTPFFFTMDDGGELILEVLPGYISAWKASLSCCSTRFHHGSP